MGCIKHGIHNCSACDGTTINITKSENNSLGRDGESAYDAYVRVTESKGEVPLPYDDWALLNGSIMYEEFNWV